MRRREKELTTTLPVLADKSWLRRVCSASRNQHRALEPNSAALREKENMRRAGRRISGIIFVQIQVAVGMYLCFKELCGVFFVGGEDN